MKEIKLLAIGFAAFMCAASSLAAFAAMINGFGLVSIALSIALPVVSYRLGKKFNQLNNL